MHESVDHQASGLVSLSRAHGARLTAMVSHGDEAAELPLLWRLCLAWIELGYPVSVLDAGSRESVDNPGLEQLLDFPHTALPPTHDATAWNVVPAAYGLQNLLQTAMQDQTLELQLSGLFPEDGLVVVYGNASVLAQLLSKHSLHPLMVVSSARESLLTGYQALKRLTRAPGLKPLVVEQTSMRPQAGARHPSAAETLAECARNFLSLELPLVRLQTSTEDAITSSVQGLALRLLENALPLNTPWAPAPLSGTKMDTRQFSRSH